MKSAHSRALIGSGTSGRINAQEINLHMTECFFPQRYDDDIPPGSVESFPIFQWTSHTFSKVLTEPTVCDLSPRSLDSVHHKSTYISILMFLELAS